MDNPLQKRGGHRPGSGRKRKPIDLQKLEELAYLGAQFREMAPVLGVTTRTLENRSKEKQFRETIERGMAKRKIGIRQQLLKLVKQGNAAVTIHMSKVDLGQREHPETGVQSDRPLQISTEAINEILRRIKKPE
jgi:hypothetical protein